MKRKSKRSRKKFRQADELTASVPGGLDLWKAGIEGGVRWASAADPSEVNRYIGLHEPDIKIDMELIDGPEAISVTVTFSGAFTPPSVYAAEYPESSRVMSEPEAWLYWAGWLAGVTEQSARIALAPLMAATAPVRTLEMDPPRHHECPICWVERNLGVRIVIREPGDSKEAA